MESPCKSQIQKICFITILVKMTARERAYIRILLWHFGYLERSFKKSLLFRPYQKNYHGFPFVFHEYDEIISVLYGFEDTFTVPSARVEHGTVKPIFYVDAIFDFDQLAWFTGNGSQVIIIETFYFQNFIANSKLSWFLTIPESKWHSGPTNNDSFLETFPRLQDRLVFFTSTVHASTKKRPSSYNLRRNNCRSTSSNA